MRIVVIGGSGLIGTRLVESLRERGYDVVAASPSKGVNAVTGEGLAAALGGADVLVDVANAPVWEDDAVLAFFRDSTTNLLRFPVGHYVALSVVETERLQSSGYFRAKLAQEQLIAASGRAYTIVRATQFFEFLSGIGQSGTVGEEVRLPSALFQPIAAADVSLAMADFAEGAPLNGMAIDDGSLTAGDGARLGAKTYQEWAAAR